MFEQIKPAKNYEQIITQIRNMIIDGSLKKGDKLPSERELAEQLNVSRASVREAIIALHTTGIVETKHGEGNFIKKSFENSLLEPLSLVFILENRSIEELYEVRRILEIEVAGLAATRFCKEDVTDLEAMMIKIYSAQPQDIVLNSELDKEFHYLIARISRNFLIINVLNVISQLMDSSIQHVRKKILIEKENDEKLATIHRNICSKILKKDAAGAKKAMKEHFDFTSQKI